MKETFDEYWSRFKRQHNRRDMQLLYSRARAIGARPRSESTINVRLGGGALVDSNGLDHTFMVDY